MSFFKTSATLFARLTAISMIETNTFPSIKSNPTAEIIENRVALARKNTNATLFLSFYIKFHFFKISYWFKLDKLHAT